LEELKIAVYKAKFFCEIVIRTFKLSDLLCCFLLFLFQSRIYKARRM